MTIKEAIAQLEDLRKDRESFAKNDEFGKVFEQDIEAIDAAVKALKENAELKRLLKLAMSEISSLRFDSLICPQLLHRTKWKHADEALRLIGE